MIWVKIKEECGIWIVIGVRVRCGMRLSASWISKSDFDQTWMFNNMWVTMRT